MIPVLQRPILALLGALPRHPLLLDVFLNLRVDSVGALLDLVNEPEMVTQVLRLGAFVLHAAEALELAHVLVVEF